MNDHQMMEVYTSNNGTQSVFRVFSNSDMSNGLTPHEPEELERPEQWQMKMWWPIFMLKQSTDAQATSISKLMTPHWQLKGSAHG